MKKEEWIGTDVSLEISLFEYGLLVCHNDQCESDDEWFCLVGVQGDFDDTNMFLQYAHFDFGYWKDSEISNLDWVDWTHFLSYLGITDKKEWDVIPFIHKLKDLIDYYGWEEFGFGTYNSFIITDAGLDDYLTNMKSKYSEVSL